MMKIKQLVVLALVVGVPAWSAVAQDGSKRPHRQGPPPSQNGGAQGGSPDGAPDGPGPEGRGHRPPPPLIAALDANHDGVISADEIANAANAIKALDKNNDGQLTMDELRPSGPPPGQSDGQPGGGRPHQGPPPGGAQGDRPPHEPPTNADGTHPQRPVPPLVAALDVNGDGIISMDEIAGAAASLAKLDKNNDGQLTMDELRPAHQPPPSDTK